MALCSLHIFFVCADLKKKEKSFLKSAITISYDSVLHTAWYSSVGSELERRLSHEGPKKSVLLRPHGAVYSQL